MKTLSAGVLLTMVLAGCSASQTGSDSSAKTRHSALLEARRSFKWSSPSNVDS